VIEGGCERSTGRRGTWLGSGSEVNLPTPTDVSGVDNPGLELCEDAETENELTDSAETPDTDVVAVRGRIAAAGRLAVVVTCGADV